MNILVTGGRGFIGGHLTHQLSGISEAKVVVADSNSGGLITYRNNITNTLGDDISSLLIQDDYYDHIVHLAAWSTVRNAMYKPAQLCENNVMTTARLLEMCQHNKCLKGIVFASSSAAEDPIMSYYGASKRMGENLFKCFTDITATPVACLRFGNVYGPGQNPRNGTFISLLTEWAYHLKSGRAYPEVKIFGDGYQTRDYIYVADVVKAILYCIENNINGVHNVSTGTSKTTNYLYKIFRLCAGKVYNYWPPENLLHVPSSPLDKGEVTLPPSKIMQNITTTAIGVGIMEQLKWRNSMQGDWLDPHDIQGDIVKVGDK